MRRIINCREQRSLFPTVSAGVLFALGTTYLFAASNDPNSSDGNWGFFGAILGVVVPALLVVAIGSGIYARLRRKKPSFTKVFSRRRPPKDWDISSPTYTFPSPSPAFPRNTVHANMPDPLTGPDRPLEGDDEYTLESIALTDLDRALSLRESNHTQEYYEAIAIIIKQYVGEKYQIKSLDATTGQILSALPNGLTDSVTDHVGEILRSCDMIQFSRHRPSRSEQHRIYETAREFIESQIVSESGFSGFKDS